MLGHKFYSRMPQTRLKVTVIQFHRFLMSGSTIFIFAYIDEGFSWAYMPSFLALGWLEVVEKIPVVGGGQWPLFIAKLVCYRPQ